MTRPAAFPVINHQAEFSVKQAFGLDSTVDSDSPARESESALAQFPPECYTPVQVILSEFADKYFLIISQRSKLGSLTLATLDAPPCRLHDVYSFQDCEQALLESPSKPKYHIPISTKTVLGRRDDPLPTLYASHILHCMVEHDPSNKKPLLLSMSLNSFTCSNSMDAFEGIHLQAHHCLLDHVLAHLKAWDLVS